MTTDGDRWRPIATMLLLTPIDSPCSPMSVEKDAKELGKKEGKMKAQPRARILAHQLAVTTCPTVPHSALTSGKVSFKKLAVKRAHCSYATSNPSVPP